MNSSDNWRQVEVKQSPDTLRRLELSVKEPPGEGTLKASVAGSCERGLFLHRPKPVRRNDPKGKAPVCRSFIRFW